MAKHPDILLLEETFTEFPLGKFPYNYGPWTGDGQEFALLNASVQDGGLIDGCGRRVLLFPDDGHPVTCYESLDLTGDPRDELVVWDHQRIFIYTQDTPSEGERIYNPIRQPHHNASNYRGEFSIPRWMTLKNGD